MISCEIRGLKIDYLSTMRSLVRLYLNIRLKFLFLYYKTKSWKGISAWRLVSPHAGYNCCDWQLRLVPCKLHVHISFSPQEKDLYCDVLFQSIYLSTNRALNTMVYYGLSYNTPNLPGDMYVNFFIGQMVEIPSVAATMWVIYKWVTIYVALLMQ